MMFVVERLPWYMRHQEPFQDLIAMESMDHGKRGGFEVY